MTLPHYKPHANEETQFMLQGAFPIILVPDDPQIHRQWGRKFIRSKLLMAIFGSLAVAACGVALWLLLDPNSRSLNLKALLLPGIVLGVCALYFVLAAWAGKNQVESTSDLSDLSDDPAPLVKKVRESLVPPTTTEVAVFFEEWSSEPFDEIIDEALLAEVFNDEMLAPDHMVFSLQLAE